MEWKKIDGFKERYSVSDTGLVRNDKTGRIRKPYLDSRGLYVLVHIDVDGVQYNRLVHRLVAEAFIPNPDNKETVNHKDGNKQNNCVDNLEWATRSENQAHAWRELDNGERKKKFLKSNISQYRTAESIEKASRARRRSVIRIEDGKRYRSVTEASKDNNVTHSAVVVSCKHYANGDKQRKRGVHFRYGQ